MGETTRASKRRKRTEEKEQKPSEAERVAAWRTGFFMEVLPNAPLSDINSLVASTEVSPHEARALLASGCPPELVPKILA